MGTMAHVMGTSYFLGAGLLLKAVILAVLCIVVAKQLLRIVDKLLNR